MSDPESSELSVGKVSKSMWKVTVRLPSGETFTDKLDITLFRARERFIKTVGERYEGLCAAELRGHLEDYACEDTAASSDAEGHEGNDGCEEIAGKTQADQLVSLALETYRLGRTTADEAFAVPRDGSQIVRMLRGSGGSLRSELAREFYRRHKKVPSSSALADAMAVLEGEALESPAEPVHLRIAEVEDKLVLDLGSTSGRCVVVSADGWTVEQASPVLFRRTELTGEIPEPVRGGSLNELRSLLNVSDESWPLLIGVLVAAMIPEIPHPIVLMGGQQGTGKSTGARLIASVLDSGPAVLRSPPRDLESWAMNLSGSWIVVIDNISRIPEWLSDALCRAATGDGIVRRKLYSDGALHVLEYRRVIFLTSIDAGALKGDLGDRIVLLDLEPIPATERRSEKEVNAEFRRVRPRVLGALLDVVSKVLAIRPKIELDEKSRMADVCLVLAAVDEVLGSSALEAYETQRGRVAEEVVESDPFAMAIVGWARETRAWSGTAGELLDLLGTDGRPRDWPKNARAVGGRLRRLTPALAGVGIEVVAPTEKSRGPGKSRARIWTVRLVQGEGEDSVRTVRPSENGLLGVEKADSGSDGRSDGRCASPAQPSETDSATKVETAWTF